ncbi:MAG: hypothetical protein ACOX17_03315 [Christensenellales bacterium]|jgi:hypothetical protein
MRRLTLALTLAALAGLSGCYRIPGTGATPIPVVTVFHEDGTFTYETPSPTMTQDEELEAFVPDGLTINSYEEWPAEARQGYETADGYYLEEASGSVTLFYARQAPEEESVDAIRLMIVQHADTQPENLIVAPCETVESSLLCRGWIIDYMTGNTWHREIAVHTDEALLRMGASLPAAEKEGYFERVETWLMHVYLDDNALAEQGSGIFSDGSVIGDYACFYDREGLPYWQEGQCPADDMLLYLENAKGGVITVTLGEAAGLLQPEDLSDWLDTVIADTYDETCVVSSRTFAAVGSHQLAGLSWQVDYAGDTLWREYHVTIVFEEKWFDFCCTLRGKDAAGLEDDFTLFLASVTLDGIGA